MGVFSMKNRRLCAFAVAVSLVSSTVPSATFSATMQESISQHVTTDKVVHYTTGINPQDYPCARAGIAKLYEKRSALDDLERYHPKRVFVWIWDSAVYYTMVGVNYVKGLLQPNAMANGIRNVRNMASGGSNPLAGINRKISGWADNLSPSSQYAMQRKVEKIIKKSTNSDGSCKA